MSCDCGVDVLVDRLRDQRSRKVVFLSHCLLNENTRYLGGACRRSCVREIVEQCVAKDIGMVQMPCPEEEAWGGVLKRRMLRLVGSAGLGKLATFLAPLAVAATRRIYRRLAGRVAAQIADYVVSGLQVVGVGGGDASPSCGVSDHRHRRRRQADGRPRRKHNRRRRPERARPPQRAAGRGLFIDELRGALEQRGLRVPFLAHDLRDELDGRISRLKLE